MSRPDDLDPETMQRLRDEVSLSRAAIIRHLSSRCKTADDLDALTASVDRWAADELYMLDNLAEWGHYFDALERAARCCPFSGPLYYLEQLEAFAGGCERTPEEQRRGRLLRHIVYGEYYSNIVRRGGFASQVGRKAKWLFLCGDTRNRRDKGLRFVTGIEDYLLQPGRGEAANISMQMWHFRHFIYGTLPATPEEGEKIREAEQKAGVAC